MKKGWSDKARQASADVRKKTASGAKRDLNLSREYSAMAKKAGGERREHLGAVASAYRREAASAIKGAPRKK